MSFFTNFIRKYVKLDESVNVPQNVQPIESENKENATPKPKPRLSEFDPLKRKSSISKEIVKEEKAFFQEGYISENEESFVDAEDNIQPINKTLQIPNNDSCLIYLTPEKEFKKVQDEIPEKSQENESKLIETFCNDQSSQVASDEEKIEEILNLSLTQYSMLLNDGDCKEEEVKEFSKHLDLTGVLKIGSVENIQDELDEDDDEIEFNFNATRPIQSECSLSVTKNASNLQSFNGTFEVSIGGKEKQEEKEFVPNRKLLDDSELGKASNSLKETKNLPNELEAFSNNIQKDSLINLQAGIENSVQEEIIEQNGDRLQKTSFIEMENEDSMQQLETLPNKPEQSINEEVGISNSVKCIESDVRESQKNSSINVQEKIENSLLEKSIHEEITEKNKEKPSQETVLEKIENKNLSQLETQQSRRDESIQEQVGMSNSVKWFDLKESDSQKNSSINVTVEIENSHLEKPIEEEMTENKELPSQKPVLEKIKEDLQESSLNLQGKPENCPLGKSIQEETTKKNEEKQSQESVFEVMEDLTKILNKTQEDNLQIQISATKQNECLLTEDKLEESFQTSEEIMNKSKEQNKIVEKTCNEEKSLQEALQIQECVGISSTKLSINSKEPNKTQELKEERYMDKEKNFEGQKSVHECSESQKSEHLIDSELLISIESKDSEVQKSTKTDQIHCESETLKNVLQKAEIKLEPNLIPKNDEESSETDKKELNEALERNLALERELAELKMKIKASEEEFKKREEFHESNKMQEQDIVALKSEIEVLDRDCAEKDKEIAMLKDIIAGYDKIMENLAERNKKLKEEKALSEQHLSNMEIAFSDLHTKFERTKSIINGYVANEKVLQENLTVCNNTIKQLEEKYKTMKAHSFAAVEKANEEIMSLKESIKIEENKMNAIKKTSEIKIASLLATLEQKDKEIQALSLVCDEFTGNTLK